MRQVPAVVGQEIVVASAFRAADRDLLGPLHGKQGFGGLDLLQASLDECAFALESVDGLLDFFQSTAELVLLVDDLL